MDALKTTICVLWLWSLVVLGKCQLQDDDCTFNCTCCQNKECGPGKYFESECKHGCIDGYTGARCYLKCADDCIKCYRHTGTCSECKTGKYGVDCMQNCSVGCLTNKCAVNDGKCKCSDKFYGNSCDKCQIGRYGELCNNQCSFGCKNYVCDRMTGDCLDGCIVDTITGDKCDSCVEGFYGHLCHKICSKGCKNVTCQKQNGDCLLGCTEGFNGSRCNQCIEGTLVLTCGWETDNQDRINHKREDAENLKITRNQLSLLFMRTLWKTVCLTLREVYTMNLNINKKLNIHIVRRWFLVLKAVLTYNKSHQRHLQ